MYTMYDVGDNVILKGTVESVTGTSGHALYKLREYDVPIREEDIVGKIADTWKLEKKREKE